MKQKFVIYPLLIVLVALAAGVGACKAPNRIDFGSRTLTNDTWGAAQGENITSGIFLNKDKSFGWYWDRLDPKKKPGETFVKPIFPQVRIGGAPTLSTNSASFPVKLSDVKSLRFTVDYEYTTLPEGSYNLAYEMLLSDKNKPSANLIPKAEVMVWLHATFPQPPNTYQGDFTDGINTYQLYSWTMTDGRLYASFIMKGPGQFKAQHTVDVGKLMANLTLDSAWYLHGVELGSEIVSGSGRIQINTLNIVLNGSEAKGKLYWWQSIFHR